MKQVVSKDSTTMVISSPEENLKKLQAWELTVEPAEQNIPQTDRIGKRPRRNTKPVDSLVH
ncbi:Hypothetical predicted protein, partial [Pelobates cultripes]